MLRPWFVANKDPEFAVINLDMHIFGGYCLSLFSCVNQFSVINIISEIERPSKRRINKVITRSAIFPLLIYLIIGLIGYGTYGSLTPPVIVDRPKEPGTYDIPMTIARGLLIVCLITGIIIRSNSNESN